MTPSPRAGVRYHSLADGQPPLTCDGLSAPVWVPRGEAELNALLPKLKDLRAVTLDAAYLSMLSTDKMPRVSDVFFAGAGKGAWPTGPWTALRYLNAAEVSLKFAAADLPAVEKLLLMVAGKREWAEVAKLSTVWALQAGPMDEKALATLAPLPLEILVFRRGNIGDLEGLKKFSKLTEWGAILCPELRDLSTLSALPQLTDVMLHDCPHLDHADAILELPNLRNAMIYGCKDPTGKLRRSVRALRKRGVGVVSELEA